MGVYVCVISDQRLEKFGRFVRSMDDSLKQLSTVCDSNAKKHQGRMSLLVNYLFAAVTELCVLH